MNRAAIFDKFGGRCAYCGVGLAKGWHADHLHPKHRGGTDEESNLMPACARCNRWKATFTVDEFRQEIAAQVQRLTKYSGPFRMAKDFGLLTVGAAPVQFYFELQPRPSLADEGEKV